MVAALRLLLLAAVPRVGASWQQGAPERLHAEGNPHAPPSCTSCAAQAQH